METLQHRYFKWLLAGVAGAAIAIPFLFYLHQLTRWRDAVLLLAYACIWALITPAVHSLLFRFAFPRMEGSTVALKSLWLSGYLLAGLWLTHNIPLHYPDFLFNPFPYSWLLKILFLGGAGLAIGLLLFVLSVGLANWSLHKPDSINPTRFRWVQFALPMVAVWVIYLLAFWPGMMSADSMVQWEQVLNGQYNDHHPVFHTLTIWLATRIYPSPAAVAIAQIFSLSLLVGFVLAHFETLGIPPALLWTASFLFALTPVNGAMVVTIWKDIPYSTAVLGFTFLIFRLVQSSGRWIVSWKNGLIFGVTAACVALFRHNGLPIILGVCILLLFIYYHRWKYLVLSLTVSFLLYFGVRGPLYDLIQVEEPTVLMETSTSLYSAAASASPGTEMNEVFLTVQPFSNNPVCDLPLKLYEAGQQMDAQYENVPPEQSLLNLARLTPNLMLYYYRCNRSLVWKVWDPSGEVRNPSHAEVWIDPNPFGITPDSRIPFLQDEISDFVVETSRDPEINWLVWRPALYLYLFLWVISVQALRHRNIWWLLVAAPILIQSIGSTVINIAPNFRYHYATYLVALLFWPILFSPRIQPADSAYEETIHPGEEALAG